MQLEPWDEHNQRLIGQVHPADWTNPTPADAYNLVVVGGGTAGLVSAMGAAGLGAKVALVERHLLGGDCLNLGCVPSKALIRAARAAADARDAGRFGVRTGPVTVDFPAVMERMRRLRADIAVADSAARFRDAGVDVFLGEARFLGPDRIAVGDVELPFHRAVLATGGHAWAPPIPGLREAGFLTNETVFSLTELPAKLGVIGGGPIGCELAQCFARFGSEVTLVEREDRILPKDDPDAVALVAASLERDGVRILTGVGLDRVEDGSLVIGEERVPVDRILVALGRRPNLDGLGLAEAGVTVTEGRLVVDDHLCTTNPAVYACGDVAQKHQFTHAADFGARIVIRNALFPGSQRESDLLVPWATYTDPEVAHVGLTPARAAELGVELRTFTQELADVDRAILDGETEGFARVHVAADKDRILGATVVARHAGDLISELTLAMQHGVGLGGVASVIHPYPTQADALRKLGDAMNRTRLTPFVAGAMKRWLAFRR